jgi:beta-1,2-mannosidase
MHKILATILVLIVFSCKENAKDLTQIEKPYWAMLDFVKVDSINPILLPTTTQNFDCPVSKKLVNWEEKNVLNPSAIVKDGKVYLLYRAQDSMGTSRLGLAISDDGLHFVKQAKPVFYPDNDAFKKYEWRGGVEDPRIVESDEGTYILTYTSYDGKTARLMLATSKDLLHWEKKGPVLHTPKYINTWSKSGAIVAKNIGDKIIATKIDGKYWMYFGDTDLFMATSTDLIHWEVAENEENKKIITVLHPRMGYFDSRLVEPGPFALLQDNGILLIYNASNAANFNDTSLSKFTYSAGQALFHKNKPYQLLDRTNRNFIHPDKPYEKVGEVNEVCFVEGLVHFHNHWFLYYGTADSKIAVAVK